MCGSDMHNLLLPYNATAILVFKLKNSFLEYKRIFHFLLSLVLLPKLQNVYFSSCKNNLYIKIIFTSQILSEYLHGTQAHKY